MISTLHREISVAHEDSSRANDTRLVELVMAINGCTARRALEQIREKPADSPLSRVAYALSALRADIAAIPRS